MAKHPSEDFRRRRRASVTASLGLVAALTLAACTTGNGERLGDPPPRAPSEKEDLSRALSFSYEPIGQSGFIDQTLTITSEADTPLAMKGRLAPLDGTGKPVPGVIVHTLYGSDAGRLVVMPGDNLDILSFEGAGVSQVQDVRVTTTEVEAVTYPTSESW